MKRKFLAFLLAFVMVAGMLPMTALAAGEDEATPAEDPIQTALGVASDAQGVYALAKDVTLSETLSINKNVTINLSGHTLTVVASNGIVVGDGATLTIQDSTATDPTVSDAGEISGYTGGKIKTASAGDNSKNYMIVVKGGGTLNVESGMLDAENNAIMTESLATKTGTVNVSGGYIKAGLYKGIVPFKNGKVSVTGGVLEGMEDYLISAAGDQDTDGNPTQGDVTISITGGTLVARAPKPSGSGLQWGSLGVYMPTSGTLTVGGDAKIISTKGPGIVFRGGQGAFTVDGGEIIATGTETTKVGAFKTQGVVPAAVVLDGTATHYPVNAETKIDISGGKFSSDSTVPVVFFAGATEGSTQEFNITGGTFSSNPFETGEGKATNVVKPADYKYNTTTRKVELDMKSATVAISVDNSEGVYWQGDKVVNGAASLIDNGVAKTTGSTVKVTGTAKYITGWTAFNGTDKNEQSGNYLPLRIKITDSAADSSNGITDLVQKVTVKGNKTKEFTGEAFFDGEGENANSGVLIMRLNNLIGNAGLAEGTFQIIIEFKPKVDVEDASKAATATKGAEVVYNIDCTGITLEMPKIESGNNGTLDLTGGKADQVNANIANIINAAAAPNDTTVEDGTGETPEIPDPGATNKTVTIPFTVSAGSSGTDKGGTVKLPTAIVDTMKTGANGVKVAAKVETEAATVELPAAAIGKLSSSDATEIKVATMNKSATSGDTMIPVPPSDSNAVSLKDAVDSAVDVTVKCGSSEPFKNNSDDAASISISIKVSASGSYHVLYFSSTAVEKMSAAAITAVSDNNGGWYVPFTTKHLSVYGAVPSNETNDALVKNLEVNEGASGSEQGAGQLKITMADNPVNGLYKATVTGLNTNNTYTVQISRGTNAAPAVIFTFTATATAMDFSVNAGSVISIWAGAVTIVNGVPSASTSPVTATAGA